MVQASRGFQIGANQPVASALDFQQEIPWSNLVDHRGSAAAQRAGRGAAAVYRADKFMPINDDWQNWDGWSGLDGLDRRAADAAVADEYPGLYSENEHRRLMPHSILIVPSKIEDVYRVANNLRSEDKAEITGFGLDPKEALRTSFRHAIIRRTAFVDGEIAAMWGLGGAMLSRYRATRG